MHNAQRLFVAFVALHLLGCSPQVATVNVLEYACAEPATKDPACKGRHIGADLLFHINLSTGHVAVKVRTDPNGHWPPRAALYEKCVVVDSDNWACTTSPFDYVEMSN